MHPERQNQIFSSRTANNIEFLASDYHPLKLKVCSLGILAQITLDPGVKFRAPVAALQCAVFSLCQICGFLYLRLNICPADIWRR